MGNVCTITQCRRKRDHQVIPESFQEKALHDAQENSPPASGVSSQSESGIARFI